jgi:hypothetical protein
VLSSPNHNPLYFVQRDFIAAPTIELRGARTFIRRHESGGFDRAADFQITRDAGSPEGVAADLDGQAEFSGAAADQCEALAPLGSGYISTPRGRYVPG